MLSSQQNLQAMEDLLETMRILRSPEGCPWDKEQTHSSLKKYLVEEAYEVLEAIDSGSSVALLEELGDVLFQVCIHSQIAAEEGHFNFAEVANFVNKKMISRHPHVFDKDANSIKTAEQVIDQWEKIKAQEKKGKPQEFESPFSSIPQHLPSLFRAVKVLKKADKLKLSIDNTTEKTEDNSLDDVLHNITTEEELGQLLLQVAKQAKKIKLDPEEALRQAVAKIQLEFEGKLQ
jgi:tetrapyrrole methylase family protein/MazG family protein